MNPNTNINQPAISPFQQFLRSKYMVGFVLVFIALLGFTLYQNSHFRFVGLKANGARLSGNSPVILQFNRSLTNREEIIKSMSISPRLDTDILVNDKNITISAVDGLPLNVKYTVKISSVTSKSGSTLKDLVITFEAKNTTLDTNNSVDLEDIVDNKYPQLASLEAENEDYDIGHELSKNTLILTISLYPKHDISLSDQEADQVLINLNAKVIGKIKASGINLNSIDLRYDIEHQNDLLYQASIREIKQNSVGG